MADYDTYRELQEKERQRQMGSGGGGNGGCSPVVGCLAFFVALFIIGCLIVGLIYWRDDNKPDLFHPPRLSSNSFVSAR
jgi:tellurite resistance protein TehA-like permease